MRCRRDPLVTRANDAKGAPCDFPPPLPQPSKWRWRVVFTLDKLLPGMCWSYLVDWVYSIQKPEDEREGDKLRYCWQVTCAEDADRLGSCYCGKVKSGR